MPIKKKSVGRGGKDKKGGKEKPSSDGLNEQTKVAFLVEIQEVEKRLGRYQTKHDELKALNDNFQDQLNKMVMEQREAVAFFGKELQNRVEEIADLNDRLIGLQQMRDLEKERQESELHELRTEFKDTKDRLTSENSAFALELSQLDDYRVRKEDFIAQLAALEEQVLHQKEMHSLDNEHLQWKETYDRDRLKAQMVHRLNQVAATFRKASNLEMAETTKRAIRENVSIQEQVGKMSDKSMEVTAENEELRESTKKGKLQIVEMEKREAELTKNYISSNKIIKMLKEQEHAQQAQLIEFELREEQCRQLEIEADVIETKHDETRDEMRRLNENNKELEASIRELKEKTEDENSAIVQMKDILAAADSVLQEVVRGNLEEDDNFDDGNSETKHSGVLNKLLDILERRHAVLPGFSARDTWAQPTASVTPNCSIESTPRQVSGVNYTRRTRSAINSNMNESIARHSFHPSKSSSVVGNLSPVECESVLRQSREFLQENLLPPISNNSYCNRPSNSSSRNKHL